MRGLILESLESLGALGVGSVDSEPKEGLVGSSPRSLDSGVGVVGCDELKGSERGSIPLTR